MLIRNQHLPQGHKQQMENANTRQSTSDPCCETARSGGADGAGSCQKSNQVHVCDTKLPAAHILPTTVSNLLTHHTCLTVFCMLYTPYNKQNTACSRQYAVVTGQGHASSASSFANVGICLEKDKIAVCGVYKLLQYEPNIICHISKIR